MEHSSEFVLIEYPAIIKNVDNALKTLGSLDDIAKSVIGNRPLELRFRPENVYQSGLLAEKKNLNDVVSGQTHLVMRVRKKRGVDEHKQKFSVQCLGIVSTIFQFKAMGDFHYLPIRKVENENCYEDLVPKLIPTTFQSALSWWDRDDPDLFKVPHFLPPFLFSRYNTPSTKILSNEVERQITNLKQGSSGQGKNLRNERKSFTVTVQGNAKFPMAPTEAAIKDVEIRVKNTEPHRLITEMFAERPMWTRAAIIHITNLDESLLKILLAKYAFYIVSGPWGRLWCRFGYDPRLDPSAKQYQTVMVSFRRHQNIPERTRLRVSLGGGASTSAASKEFPQVLDYIYKQGILPPVRQNWYCVCDVMLPAAQKVLRKDFFSVLNEHHETHGWLPPEIIKSIRTAIKEDVSKITSHLEYIDADYGNNMTDMGSGENNSSDSDAWD